MKTLQAEDPFIRCISDYIQFGKNPLGIDQSAYVRSVAPSCFIKNKIIWRRISRHNMPHRNVLLLPLSLSDKIIHDIMALFSLVTRAFLGLRNGCCKTTFGRTWKPKFLSMWPPAFAAKPVAPQISLSPLF